MRMRRNLGLKLSGHMFMAQQGKTFCGEQPIDALRNQPHSNLSLMARFMGYCSIDVTTCTSEVKAVYSECEKLLYTTARFLQSVP